MHAMFFIACVAHRRIGMIKLSAFPSEHVRYKIAKKNREQVILYCFVLAIVTSDSEGGHF